MRLATIIENDRETAAVVDPARGVASAVDVADWAEGDLLAVICSGRVPTWESGTGRPGHRVPCP